MTHEQIILDLISLKRMRVAHFIKYMYNKKMSWKCTDKYNKYYKKRQLNALTYLIFVVHVEYSDSPRQLAL